MHPEDLDSLPHVKEWLGYARAAVDAVKAIAPDADDKERMKILLEQNVILQLQHLKTHPSVADRLADGTLSLHGWVYDIRTGGVTAYDETQDKFIPVDQRYAEEVSRLARVAD
jgi:carbonic anhydrase